MSKKYLSIIFPLLWAMVLLLFGQFFDLSLNLRLVFFFTYLLLTIFVLIVWLLEKKRIKPFFSLFALIPLYFVIKQYYLPSQRFLGWPFFQMCPFTTLFLSLAILLRSKKLSSLLAPFIIAPLSVVLTAGPFDYHYLILPFFFLVPLLGLLDWDFFLAGFYLGPIFSILTVYFSKGVLTALTFRPSLTLLIIPAVLFLIHLIFLLKKPTPHQN